MAGLVERAPASEVLACQRQFRRRAKTRVPGLIAKASYRFFGAARQFGSHKGISPAAGSADIRRGQPIAFHAVILQMKSGAPRQTQPARQNLSQGHQG